MKKADFLEIFTKYNLHPNKKLGQNFLCNDEIAVKIANAAGIGQEDQVIEIGPGLGILTEKLMQRAGGVTAVELDSGLFRYLELRFKDSKNLNLVHNDFLRVHLSGKFTKAVSNLPYYCSSEILFHLAIKYKIPDVYVMLQKEMAERITAAPGSKSYGALTVSLGMYYNPKILFNIEKRFFYPQPDITSSFIALHSRVDTGLSADETGLFHKLVKSVFWGRRKMLSTALSSSPHIALDKEIIFSIIERMKLSKDIRGENLSIEEFKTLTKLVKNGIK